MQAGIVKLYPSGKFWMCMIIYIPSTVALFTKHLESGSYAAIVGTIGSIFLATHVLSDIVHQRTDDRSSVK